jgi:hypothetical protein
VITQNETEKNAKLVRSNDHVCHLADSNQVASVYPETDSFKSSRSKNETTTNSCSDLIYGTAVLPLGQAGSGPVNPPGTES